MDTTHKFTGKADVYDQYRPAYAPQFLNELVAQNYLTPHSTVADIGAGTGILTRQLLDKDLHVMAVEPNADMLETARARLTAYTKLALLNGTGEATGIADHSVEVVVAAQAFHWFNADAFKTECRRILKPGGSVVLVWNNRNADDAFIKENAQVCKTFCPAFTGFSGGFEQVPEVFAAFFKNGEYTVRTFPNDIEVDLDGFIGRNLSGSYAPQPADKNYIPFVNALTALFFKYSENDRVVFRNETKAYSGKV